MSILRRVEKELDERLRRLFRAGPGEGQTREALEVQRAILDEITGKVRPVGHGRRVFPFRHLEIHIAAPDTAERALYTLAFAEGGQLASDIREALREAGCEPAPDLAAEVVLEDFEIPAGFRIVYREKPAARAAEGGQVPAARLTILEGQAERESYELGPSRVNVGRLADVLDEGERLVRRNQVAFAEAGERANATVSRAHAHIQYDPENREYRIYDDHSAFGTSVFRAGALVVVPPGGGRGVALQPGDEICFGQARARFEM